DRDNTTGRSQRTRGENDGVDEIGAMSRFLWAVSSTGDNQISMDGDQSFRFILIAGFLLIIPVGLYHRVKSQATGEKLDRRQEGIFILVSLRLLGLAGWISLLIYMIDPAWMAWSSVLLPAWLRWVGVAVMAVSGCLAIWTFRHLGKNITDTVVTRK